MLYPIPRNFPARAAIFRRLIEGAKWSLLGEAGTRALTLLATVIVARALGASDYGGYAFVQGCLAAFLTFAAFGLGQTSARYIASMPAEQSHRISDFNSLAFSVSAISGAVVAGVLFAVSNKIAIQLEKPSLAMPLHLAAPALFFSSITSALNGTLAGLEAFPRLAKQAWISAFFSFFSVMLGVAFGGLSGAAVGISVGEAGRTALAGRGVWQEFQNRGLPFLLISGINNIGVLWSFSLPTVLSGALHVPVFWFCQSILAGEDGGLRQVALYDAAQKWMTLVIFVPTAGSAIVGPVLASLHENRSAHRDTTLAVALLQLLLCIVPALFVSAYGNYAMAVFGEEFKAGTGTLSVVMVLAPISMAIRLAWSSLLSLGHAWLSCYLWLVWGAVAVPLAWNWRADGAYGLAWAMVLSYSVTLALYSFVLTREWRSASG